MVLPFVLGGVAVVAGLGGLAKGAESVTNNAEAKDILLNAQQMYEKEKAELESNKVTAASSLEELGKLKLQVWDQQLGRFVHLVEQVKDVTVSGQAALDNNLQSKISQDELLQMKEISLKAGEVVSGGFQSLGAGALAGVASYGGAMMFASASTGTAISTLSGVAATNATLAWFGGGSLAAGGMGMSGGAVVLGGIVAGPIVAVGGMLMAAKSRKNLAEAESVLAEAMAAVEEMKNASSMLGAIQDVSSQFNHTINSMNDRFTYTLDSLEQAIQEAENARNASLIFRIKKAVARLFGISTKLSYKDLNSQQKETIHVAYQFAQATKILLETPILSQEGALDDNALRVLDSTQKLLPQ